VAGLFHEIGTVCVPPDVLRKPGQLTDEEFATLRPHPLVGERLLGGLPGQADAAAIVRAERERYDGEGYPYGLAGDEIPLPARILHACDAFVAMTTPRPYRQSVSPDAALRELRRHAASQFDPVVVDAVDGFVAEQLDGFVTERR
jgi:HD-GYP domain-containing protein (c-di-GMP phosphodiesterase class II)